MELSEATTSDLLELIAQLEEELETDRERHRDAKSNFATMQRLREDNKRLHRFLTTREYEDRVALEAENEALKRENARFAKVIDNVWSALNEDNTTIPGARGQMLADALLADTQESE